MLSPTRTLPCHTLQLHPRELERTSSLGVFDDGVLLDSALMPWLPAVMRHVLRLDVRKQSEEMWEFTYYMLLSKFKLGPPSARRGVTRRGGAVARDRGD